MGYSKNDEPIQNNLTSYSTESVFLNYTQRNSLPIRAKAKNAQEGKEEEEHLGREESYGEEAGERERDEEGRGEEREEA